MILQWNGMCGLSKAVKQEELKDTEIFSGNCYPTAASYFVFFSSWGYLFPYFSPDTA